MKIGILWSPDEANDLPSQRNIKFIVGNAGVSNTHLVDEAEGVRHKLNNSIPDAVLPKVHLIQELLGHREQRALGPGLEPVDDGGGDCGQEALGADAEVLTHRGGGVDLQQGKRTRVRG